MAFGNNEFPNAAYYDSDLRELIRLYHELKKEYKSIVDALDKLEKYYEEIDSVIDDKVKQQTDIALSLYLQRLIAVEQRITQLEESLNNVKLDVNELYQITDAIKADLSRKYYELKEESAALLELMHEWKRAIDTLYDGKFEELRQYVYEVVAHIDRLYVINPISGLFEDIQKVIDDIYKNLLFSYGLTAKEYDELMLTAFEYDNMNITALMYSTRAYFIFWERTIGFMRSPFTGTMTHYSNIIQKLVDFHRYSLTAKQYDDLLLQAMTYDALKLTAYNYDWHGRRYFEGETAENAITAEIYSGLKYNENTGYVLVPREYLTI